MLGQGYPKPAVVQCWPSGFARKVTVEEGTRLTDESGRRCCLTEVRNGDRSVRAKGFPLVLTWGCRPERRAGMRHFHAARVKLTRALPFQPEAAPVSMAILSLAPGLLSLDQNQVDSASQLFRVRRLLLKT